MTCVLAASAINKRKWFWWSAKMEKKMVPCKWQRRQRWIGYSIHVYQHQHSTAALVKAISIISAKMRERERRNMDKTGDEVYSLIWFAELIRSDSTIFTNKRRIFPKFNSHFIFLRRRKVENNKIFRSEKKLNLSHKSSNQCIDTIPMFRFNSSCELTSSSSPSPSSSLSSSIE